MSIYRDDLDRGALWITADLEGALVIRCVWNVASVMVRVSGDDFFTCPESTRASLRGDVLGLSFAPEACDFFKLGCGMTGSKDGLGRQMMGSG